MSASLFLPSGYLIVVHGFSPNAFELSGGPPDVERLRILREARPYHPSAWRVVSRNLFLLDCRESVLRAKRPQSTRHCP